MEKSPVINISGNKAGGSQRQNRPTYDMERLAAVMGIRMDSQDSLASSLPYAQNDVTVGCENELQTAVAGRRDSVDLPLRIIESSYYQNLARRAAAGETSTKIVHAIEAFVNDNEEEIWENSWVRFHRAALNEYADRIFKSDLLYDKKMPDGPLRGDTGRFVVLQDGEPHLRVPASYLLKLSLADAVGEPDIDPLIREIAERCMGHFLNDNTSPETISFYPVPLTDEFSMGRGIVKEALTRFLLCQCLTEYANEKFGLRSGRQEAMIYFAPNPPICQKRLNNLISDSFYRELFMSPCLSGWDRGEEKHQYMNLCHQVMSRSQLNTIRKLKEANIITNNLVVLPNISNISLANNGTHISLGSRKMTDLVRAGGTDFTAHDEKYVGDLAIKVVEHFLPLFVGTYTAAPYRLDFADFHPETALGFLPHELDFTHLRMIWRRWKKKANLKVFGRPVTPFGPEWLDRKFGAIFRLKGDFVHDFRMIDYFVSLMSTDQSPGLDGQMGNDHRLRKDLASMGVFDNCMSLYLLYRNRAYLNMGFSGFEGRHYSLFENMYDDMGEATNLQTLITALAFKYMMTNKIGHASIPDDPTVESERRQIVYGSAIGIPTFFVSKDTKNLLMRKILKKTARIRSSRRYPGYLRVYHQEYKKALIAIIREDAADLIEMMGLESMIENLVLRIESFQTHSAAARLTRGILDEAGTRSALDLKGNAFNSAAEKYYRHTLCRRHMNEAFEHLAEDIRRIDNGAHGMGDDFKRALRFVLPEGEATKAVESWKRQLMTKSASADDLRKFIFLLLIVIDAGRVRARLPRSDEQTGICRKTGTDR